MTKPTENFQRESLDIDPALVIKTLPAMGKLMITAKNLGATHERIGVIENIAEADGWLVCSGAEHSSRIDPKAIAGIVVDRTSVMGTQAYPRIDFSNGEGVVLFSVVGFAGLEPFDAALAGLGRGEELPVEEKPAAGERGEVSESDPGAVPFKDAQASAHTVKISFDRHGFSQEWAGVIEQVKPAMGFINVMRSDFHLHLKAGAVADWRETGAADGVVFKAVSADGQELGLAVHGQAAAFAKTDMAVVPS